MNAIYKGKLYIVDGLGEAELFDPDTKEKIKVSYGESDLIIDPTDDQINNLLD